MRNNVLVYGIVVCWKLLIMQHVGGTKTVMESLPISCTSNSPNQHRPCKSVRHLQKRWMPSKHNTTILVWLCGWPFLIQKEQMTGRNTVLLHLIWYWAKSSFFFQSWRNFFYLFSCEYLSKWWQICLPGETVWKCLLVCQSQFVFLVSRPQYIWLKVTYVESILEAWITCIWSYFIFTSANW